MSEHCQHCFAVHSIPHEPRCPNHPMHAAEQIRMQHSELAALRDKYAILEEARDAEMLKVMNRDAEIAELRTKLEELKDELCEAQLRLLGCKRAVTLEKSRAEEAERKLAEHMVQPCCQEWHTCERACLPRAENWKVAAEEAERKLADARAEGMEEAAKVCDAMDTEQFPGNQMVFQRDCARRLSAAIRSAIEKERG